jgi:hypothetical protein
MNVQGSAWISNEDSDEYWAEGISCRVEVEVTDVDEIRLGVVLVSVDQEAAGIYLSRKNADVLSRFLSAASVTAVNVPTR